MINVNQITAQMARMPDAALQRYAQMNKSDPYIVSLALSEANRRKEIRTGAQINAPQQPKVVDQELAGMAQPMPENVGIGQLPAKNLQGMAAGGIVAFDEGGEVPRFNGNQSQFVQDINALGSYLTPFSKERMDRIRAEDAAKAAAEKESAAKRAAQIEAGRPRSLAAYLSNYFTSPDAKMREAESFLPAAPQAPTEQAVLQATQNVKTPAGSPTAANMNTLDKAPAGAAADVAPPAADKSGLYALNKPAFVPGQGLGLGTSPSTYASELEAMQPQGEVKSPFESGIRAVGEKVTDAAKKYADLRDQQMKDAGLAGIEQEKRLQAREEKLGKAEGDNAGLALLKAGFAMMGGTSQHGLVNIGAGANVGLEDYVKGRDKLDAARERLDDAFDRLAQIRRGELMMNQKEKAQNEREINNTITQTEKDVLAGAQQAYGWKKEDIRAAYNAYVTDNRTRADITSRERLGLAEIAGRKEAAAISAQAPLELYRALGSAKPDSALRQGFELSKEADKIPMLYKMYTTNVADPLKGGEFMARYPTFEAYLEGYQVGKGGTGGGFVQPPANATVLKAPGQR
jgi:hypothetical protein